MLAGLVGLGLCMRFYWIPSFPFREDEAIYAYWALYALHEDSWFLQVWPDKPPLFYGLLALLFRLFGHGEPVVRGLNIVASTATIVVVVIAARRLWGRPAGVAAGLILTLNPLAISFAPTGYTDPLMILLGALAIYAGSLGAALWAGLFLGAAVMTKQQGLLFAPLVVGMVLLSLPAGRATHRWTTQPGPGRVRLQAMVRLAAGLLAIVGPIVYWDSLRWAVAPSPWDRAVQNYAPLALLPPGQWPSRLWQWGDYVRYTGGGWTGWGWLFMAAGGALWRWRRWQADAAHFGHATFLEARSFPEDMEQRAKARVSMVWLLVIWSVTFLVIHTVTNVQIWDRYLLPLTPAMALVGGGVTSLATQLGARIPSRQFIAVARRPSSWSLPWTVPWHAVLMAGLVLCFLPQAMAAARGALPLGGDHGEYAGLNEVMAYIRMEADSQTGAEDGPASRSLILYHRVLGWHYQYYLYDEIQSGRIEPRWFSHSVYLADNAGKTPYPRKFLVMPAWAPLSDLPLHLSAQRLTAHEVMQAGNFVLLELSSAARPACDWCQCVRPLAAVAETLFAAHPTDPIHLAQMSPVASP